MQKRIVILGGVGFIGTHLCLRLLEEGHEVFCVDIRDAVNSPLLRSVLQHPLFRYVHHNIINTFGIRCDEIYNLTSSSRVRYNKALPVETLRINMQGTINALDTARMEHARILFASSGCVYGAGYRDPATDPAAGYSGQYILSEGKRAAEALHRAYQTIGGSGQWPASAVVENVGKYRDALIAEYHKYPALPPVFDFIDNEAPAKVRKMKPVWTEDGYILFWTAPKYKEEMNRAVQYVVYRFNDKEKVNIDDPSHIVAITRDNFYKLPYEDGKTKYRYVVTALDRLHNESKSVGKKIKL